MSLDCRPFPFLCQASPAQLNKVFIPLEICISRNQYLYLYLLLTVAHGSVVVSSPLDSTFAYLCDLCDLCHLCDLCDTEHNGSKRNAGVLHALTVPLTTESQSQS